MSRKFTLTALVAALSAAGISLAFGHSAEVHERMMVRNMVPPRLNDSIRPVVARDAAPGAGIFEYSEGPVGYGWPLVAVGPDSAPYNVAVLDSDGYFLNRTRMATWDVWDSVSDVAGSGNQPMFETHNIASSPVSNKVCITWVRTDTTPMPGYYRISGDGGANWDSIKQLVWPAAYGGDTVTSFHVSSFYPFYDDEDKLNVLAAVHPIVNDTGYIMPAGIWHWCPDNTPNWHLLRRAGCAPEHLAAPVGYNALYACRPSGCRYAGGDLLACWEQFDSANVDPTTNLLRAAVHVCRFYRSGGVGDTARITEYAPFSFRFPVAAPCTIEFTPGAMVSYEIDQAAGFAPLGQGPCRRNPIVTRQLTFIKGVSLGSLDTIGGTTYDLQTCGPARTAIRYSSYGFPYGIHAAWMHSEDTTGAFPDLNVRYNFFDYYADFWNWIDIDFMESGVHVFPYSAALGCIEVDHATGDAVISACTPPPLPHVAVEEGRKPQAPSRKPGPTIVRGILNLQPAIYNLQSEIVLLDVGGRKVLTLKPGANDVSALSPGVYFVRSTIDTRQASSTAKVIITK